MCVEAESEWNSKMQVKVILCVSVAQVDVHSILLLV